MKYAQQMADDAAGCVGVRQQRAEGDAATMGKKISAPSQTMSARERRVRRTVFMGQEY